MKRKIMLALMVLVLVFGSTCTTFASNDTWSYKGYEFKITDTATQVSIKNSIDAAITKKMNVTSFYTGMNAITIQSDLFQSNTQFRKLFLKTDIDEFRTQVTPFIQSQYSSFNVIEKDYNWYYSQKDTGKYSARNCGVACIAMTMKMVDESFNMSVEQVRNKMGHSGGTSFKQISDFFTKNGIEHKDVATKEGDLTPLLDKINNEQIIIIAVDANLGLSYALKSGEYHGIILNGCFEYKGKKYVTVFDPAEHSSQREYDKLNVHHMNDIDLGVIDHKSAYAVFEMAYFAQFVVTNENIAVPSEQ